MIDLAKKTPFDLPADFESLHDIRDFGRKYKETISFIDKIKTYQHEYLRHMLKTWDEVTLYIPEEQLKDTYKVCLQDNVLCKWDELNLEEIQKAMPDRLSYERKQYKLMGIDIIGLLHKRDKLFLVDTVNKKIHLCFWYENNAREKIHGWVMNKYYCAIHYSDYAFEILSDEEIFRIKVSLGTKMMLDQEKYWEWVRHTQNYGYHSYGSGGVEIYDFCMRTNTFKEYNEKESYYSWSRGSRTFKY
jgi:hypothetical protein